MHILTTIFQTFAIRTSKSLAELEEVGAGTRCDIIEELKVDSRNHALVRQLQLGVLTRLRCVNHLLVRVRSETFIDNAH